MMEMSFLGEDFMLDDKDGGGPLGSGTTVMPLAWNFVAEDGGDEMSPDFFEQYIMLDDGTSSSTGGDGSSSNYGQCCVDPALSASNHLAPSVTTMTSDAVVGEHNNRGGSVSDSELMKLEGLSVCSPRVAMLDSGGGVTRVSASVPVSPQMSRRVVGPTMGSINDTRARKPNRFEAICSTIRKAAMLRGQKSSRSSQQQRADSPRPTPNGSAAQQHLLPLSPPLLYNNTTDFVTGRLEDPFFNTSAASLASPVHLVPDSGLSHTPVDTPIIDMGAARNNNNGLAPDGTVPTSALWPHETAFFAPMARQNMHGYRTTNAKNATLNLAVQLNQRDHQQKSLAPHHRRPPPIDTSGMHHYEYPAQPSTTEVAVPNGLMIHMPQPRPSPSAVLQQQMSPMMGMQQQQQQQQHAYAALQQYPPLQQYAQAPRHQQQQQHRHYMHSESTPRRPQPRAPSSGARYHAASSSSPRKVSSSSSGGSGCNRAPSASPSPSSSRRQPRRATSMKTLVGPESSSSLPSPSVRKRKSWSHRRVSASTAALSMAECGDVDGGAAAMGGFVNYTPSDHGMLMSGVAPSGSSKTKARREKEAQERAKKLVQAVKEAGGDVDRLKKEGMLLEVG